MKKLLLTLFLLISLSCSSQSIYKDWQCENPGSWNSFYWKIKRTDYVDQSGLYYYYVYFYSNAFFNTDRDYDGQYDKAIIYVTNLNVTMNEIKGSQVYNVVHIPLPYVLADWKDKQVAYFYSYSPYCRFDIKYSEAYPYDYSVK